MDEIGIVDIMGKDVMGIVGGITGSDDGAVERFIKGSFRMMPKIL